MKRVTVVLHGKKSGYICFIHDGSKLTYECRNIPDDCNIYIVSGNTPILYSPEFNGVIHGVIVTDKNGCVMMEGRTRFDMGNNESAKIKIATHCSRKSHSDTLEKILEKADSLFSTFVDNETDYSVSKSVETREIQTVYNPFSAYYPNSSWKKITHKYDKAYHIQGTVTIANESLSITAIPTRFYSEAYFISNGFNKIINADDGTLFRARVKRL